MSFAKLQQHTCFSCTPKDINDKIAMQPNPAEKPAALHWGQHCQSCLCECQHLAEDVSMVLFPCRNTGNCMRNFRM